MELIGSLYYAAGIFSLIRLIYSLKSFSRLSRLKDWSFRYRALIGRNPTLKDYQEKEDAELVTDSIALDVFEWLWVACGLFSGNSSVFAALIIAGISIRYLSTSLSYNWLYRFISLSFILARFFIYLSMISNHFFHCGLIW